MLYNARLKRYLIFLNFFLCIYLYGKENKISYCEIELGTEKSNRNEETDKKIEEMEEKIVSKANKETTAGIEVSKINIIGNKYYKENEIKEFLGIDYGNYSEKDIKEGIEKIRKKYYENGFFDFRVEDVIRKSEDKFIIDINIYEGRRYKIGRIDIEGIKSYKKEKILKKFGIKEGDFYEYKKILEGKRNIELFYLKNGFKKSVVFLDEYKLAITNDRGIKIRVYEGKRYKFGKTYIFDGEELIQENEYKKFLTYKEGEIYNFEKVLESTRMILKKYFQEGYLIECYNNDECLKERINIIDDETLDDKMNVIIKIIKGEKKEVKKVIVNNLNSYFKERECRVIKNDISFLYKNTNNPYEFIMANKLKLEGYSIFKDIKTNVEEVNEKYIWINYDLERDKENILSAGASIGKNISTYDLSFTNMNFLGSMNKISIDFSIGKKYYRYGFRYFFPWFLDKPINLGNEAFLRRVKFPYGNSLFAYTLNSREFLLFASTKESFKKNYIFSTSYEDNEIDNIDEKYSLSIKPKDERWLNIKVGIIKRKYNNYENLKSSVHFETKLSFNSNSFLINPRFYYSKNKKAGVFEIDFINRTEFIKALKGEVPVYKKFFLGEPFMNKYLFLNQEMESYGSYFNSIRGYRFPQIGDLSGNTIYTITSLEFSIPVISEGGESVVKFLIFYDIGQGWSDFDRIRFRTGRNDNDFKTSIGSGLKITPVKFLNAMINWGYGFNHKKEEDKTDLTFFITKSF
jgi:outer membrane protein assembly factor BamA